MNQFRDPDWNRIEKIREGDSSAFGEIFNRYKTTVINLAFRFTRSREASEDIAQDVFIKIYEGRLKADPHSKFTTWLYRVTVNASIDFTRRRKFTPVSLDAEIDPSGKSERTILETVKDAKSRSAREMLKEEEVKALVQREIDRLPENLRSVILLYQFEEMPYRQIARILGVTEKAVERRLYHAKDILRKKLTWLV